MILGYELNWFVQFQLFILEQQSKDIYPLFILISKRKKYNYIVINTSDYLNQSYSWLRYIVFTNPSQHCQHTKVLGYPKIINEIHSANTHQQKHKSVGRNNQGSHALSHDAPQFDHFYQSNPAKLYNARITLIVDWTAQLQYYMAMIILELILCQIIKYTGMTCKAEEAYKMIQENASNPAFKIIDVRQHSQYQRGHLRDAIPIPLDDLPKRLNEFNKEDTHLVVCQSGNRSWDAVKMLESKGYKAINLQGGIAAWSSLKYPLQLI